MARRQIYLHAGVHRTGTSSLQMCLHENRGMIGRAGFDVAYPKRDGIPSGDLAMRLPGPRHGYEKTEFFSEKFREELEQLNPDLTRPLILSEENVPGRMIHFQAGQFYPAAEARLLALRRGLHKAVVQRVVFVVRSYDELFLSAHRKRAEDNATERFSTIRMQMVAMDRGYPEILGLIRDILKPRELVVIQYENRGSSTDLLRMLVPGLGDLRLQEPGRSLNISATDAALIALQKRYKAGETLSRPQWKAVLEDHADDRRDLGFAAFNPDQLAAVQLRYVGDLDRISRMPGVTFKS